MELKSSSSVEVGVELEEELTLTGSAAAVPLYSRAASSELCMLEGRELGGVPNKACAERGSPLTHNHQRPQGAAFEPAVAAAHHGDEKDQAAPRNRSRRLRRSDRAHDCLSLGPRKGPDCGQDPKRRGSRH